jgi:hypothetical protein
MDGISISEVVEAVKKRMCDDYCRFPREDMNDIEEEEMWEEHCSSCPLNLLD